MLGSKLIRAVKAESLQEAIADVVRIRFGEQHALDAVPILEQIGEPEQLRDLHALAIRCASVDEFRAHLKHVHAARTLTGRASRIRGLQLLG
jgi:hypothetical protein